jgi:hypothetical protein
MSKNLFQRQCKSGIFIYKTSETRSWNIKMFMPAQHAVFWRYDRLAIGLWTWFLFLASKLHIEELIWKSQRCQPSRYNEGCVARARMGEQNTRICFSYKQEALIKQLKINVRSHYIYDLVSYLILSLDSYDNYLLAINSNITIPNPWRSRRTFISATDLVLRYCPEIVWITQEIKLVYFELRHICIGIGLVWWDQTRSDMHTQMKPALVTGLAFRWSVTRSVNQLFHFSVCCKHSTLWQHTAQAIITANITSNNSNRRTPQVHWNCFNSRRINLPNKQASCCKMQVPTVLKRQPAPDYWLQINRRLTDGTQKFHKNCYIFSQAVFFNFNSTYS